MMVFAVRLDTFEAEPQSTTFYIGCNDPAELGKLRRLILTDCASLPIAGEYIHRDAFDLADRYGKDQFVTIERLGTARLPRFFALKRSEEHTSELQSLMRISYAVFCLQKKKTRNENK